MVLFIPTGECRNFEPSTVGMWGSFSNFGPNKMWGTWVYFDVLFMLQMNDPSKRVSWRRRYQSISEVFGYFFTGSPKKHLSFSNNQSSLKHSHLWRLSTPNNRPCFFYFAGSSWPIKNDKNQLPAVKRPTMLLLMGVTIGCMSDRKSECTYFPLLINTPYIHLDTYTYTSTDKIHVYIDICI